MRPQLADLDGASWITHPAWAGDDPPLRTPVLRHTFATDGPVGSARLTITGVGVWVAHLGGRPVCADVLEPGTSDVTRRVAAVTLDVGALVREGRNELVVQLGEGGAHVREVPGRYTKFVGLRLAPRLRAALVVDGRFHRTGPDWTAALGPTTLTHWYGGEEHDQRLEPPGWLAAEGPIAEGRTGGGTAAEPGWTPAAVVAAAGADPQPWARRAPPMRVVEVLVPRARHALADGSAVFDLGRNVAARQVLAVQAPFPPGAVVEMLPAEHRAPDGSVDQDSTGQPIVDRFTGRGGAATWRPQFCYHGFRYLQVRVTSATGQVLPATADLLDVTAERIMTDDVAVGDFTCSDAVLTGIDHLVTAAVQANLVSVPTDCPHREKLGWLEQLHLVFEPLAHRYDIADHFADLVDHLLDAQTPSGLVPSIAPEQVVFEGGFRDDVSWGSAIWHVPDQLHRTYGVLEPARRAWDAGLRYLSYLDDVAGAGGTGLLEGGLGDWKALDGSTPVALVCGHGHVRALEAAARLARALAAGADHSAALAARAELVRARLRRRFVTTTPRGQLACGSGSQASWALAVDAGLFTAAQRPAAGEALVRAVTGADAQITVGEIGLPPLVRLLTELGEHELLRTMATRLEGPSYGRMLADGCTSLAEDWQGTSSANHFMLGYVSRWLTGSVAGLSQHPASTGWARTRVAPVPLRGLTCASASYASAAGRHAVAWHRAAGAGSPTGSGTGDVLVVDVTVPAGASAELVTPAAGPLTGRGGTLPPAAPIELGPGSHRRELPVR